jgi:hypothetical protein
MAWWRLSRGLAAAPNWRVWTGFESVSTTWRGVQALPRPVRHPRSLASRAIFEGSLPYHSVSYGILAVGYQRVITLGTDDTVRPKS